MTYKKLATVYLGLVEELQDEIDPTSYDWHKKNAAQHIRSAQEPTRAVHRMLGMSRCGDGIKALFSTAGVNL